VKDSFIQQLIIPAGSQHAQWQTLFSGRALPDETLDLVAQGKPSGNSPEAGIFQISA